MYKYDTHVHTSEASRCGRMTGAEMARFYKKHGYDGIFITDHFVNGSTRTTPDMSWEEKMRVFCSGYEAAKAEGDRIGLDVFFGIEFNYKQTEILVYGLGADWLFSHPDCDKSDIREFSEIAHEAGAFIVHAHPFRQRPYIKAIRLYPDCVDAVETVNAAHLEDMPHDRRAEWYASEFGLARTGGSDNHVENQVLLGGILTECKLSGAEDYARAVLGGLVQPFKAPNPDYDGLAHHGVIK